MKTEIYKCCKCKHVHSSENREMKKSGAFNKSVCPKCGSAPYYLMPDDFEPFSNGAEFMSWQSNNCDKCSKYENTSTNESEAGCKLSFHLDLASVQDGKIPYLIANQIGIRKIELVSKCKEFDKAEP